METTADALSGARDIIAETISEDADLRQRIRQIYQKNGVLASRVQKGKEEEGLSTAIISITANPSVPWLPTGFWHC